jgi:hypothetical protein
MPISVVHKPVAQGDSKPQSSESSVKSGTPQVSQVNQGVNSLQALTDQRSVGAKVQQTQQVAAATSEAVYAAVRTQAKGIEKSPRIETFKKAQEVADDVAGQVRERGSEAQGAHSKLEPVRSGGALLS